MDTMLHTKLPEVLMILGTRQASEPLVARYDVDLSDHVHKARPRTSPHSSTSPKRGASLRTLVGVNPSG